MIPRFFRAIGKTQSAFKLRSKLFHRAILLNGNYANLAPALIFVVENFNA